MKKVGLVLFLCIIMVLSLSLPSLATGSEVVYQEQVTSDYNVEYTVTLFDNMSAKIHAINEAAYSRNTSYSLYLDRVTIGHPKETLSPGESETWSHNLSRIANPGKASQRVRFMILGGNIEYTYNKTTSAEDSDSVLMAEITNVSVEPSLDSDGVDLVVRVTDHSPHAYQKLLVVHSKKTHRKYGYPNTTKDNVDTVRIPLNEKQGEPVEGELRLYSDFEFRENATMDMVEFKGRANGQTSHEEVEFEQFDPGNYHYGVENNSGSEDDLAVTNDGDVTNLGIAAGMIGAGALALLSIFAVGVRRKLG